MQILLIALNEGKVVLNVPLFKQAQLCLFIHLYAQNCFVAHVLPQKNRTRRESCTFRQLGQRGSDLFMSRRSHMKWPGLRSGILSCF